jgi:hypothetical protein
MGRNVSLCLITRRAAADSLLRNFSGILDDAGRRRLGSCRWLPETEICRTTADGRSERYASGISGLARCDYDAANSYCFSFHVQMERELEESFDEQDFDCFAQPGSFGCMWTSLYAGEQFLLLQCTAASSRMSDAIEHSKTIRDLWVRLARDSHAVFAYIDLEHEMALQLFPGQGYLNIPSDSMSSPDDHRQFSVDRMTEFLLSINGV